MIATERFVFIHLHKSGGSFINAALMKFFPDARQLGYHIPASELPATYAHLPLLGVVRNPWSYYVSWYEFQQSLQAPTFVWRVFSDEGRLGFGDTVHRMLYCGQDKSIVNRLIELAPEKYSNTGVNITRKHLERLDGEPRGWYSFLFNHMYGDCPVEFIKTENLRQDFHDFLIKRMNISPELHSHIFQSEKINVTPHGSYGGYYEQALADQLATQENSIIRRFGYGFPSNGEVTR